jgi:hypothetical protein
MRIPKRALMLAPVFVLAIVFAALPTVTLGGNSRDFHAKLTGYNEVPLAINTDGFATLKLHLDDGAQSISFRYEFSGLTSNLVQSHIHFGKEHVAGNVVVFFCGQTYRGDPNLPERDVRRGERHLSRTSSPTRRRTLMRVT